MESCAIDRMFDLRKVAHINIAGTLNHQHRRRMKARKDTGERMMNIEEHDMNLPLENKASHVDLGCAKRNGQMGRDG